MLLSPWVSGMEMAATPLSADDVRFSARLNGALSRDSKGSLT